jgi:hypothetical protein
VERRAQSDRTPNLVCSFLGLLSNSALAASINFLMINLVSPMLTGSAISAQTPDPTPPGATAQSQRPALTPFPRYEDWSFLRNPANRVEMYDRLKFLPLASSGSNYVTLGAEDRTEFQYMFASDWGAGPQDHAGYLLERFMPDADFRFGNHVRIFVTLKFDDVGDKESGPRPGIDKDVADGHEGFVEIGGNLHAQHPGADVILGRQEVVLGAGRLFDDNEGVNVRNSFDGIRIGYDRLWGRIDLIAVKPVLDNQVPWDDVPNHAVTTWGVYASNVRLAGDAMSDIYYLGLDQKSMTYQTQQAREIRHTGGVRFFNRLAGAPPSHGFDYNEEIILQWGAFGDRSIHAWALANDIGWTLSQNPWRVRIALRAGAISGDAGHPASLGTFNALFPRGAYFGPKFALIAPANLLHVQPTLVFHPLRNLTGTANWIWFWRESNVDGIYTFGDLQLRAGNLSRARYIGNQPNIELRWAMNEHFTPVLNLAKSITGTFLQQAPPAKGIVFANAGLTYRF